MTSILQIFNFYSFNEKLHDLDTLEVIKNILKTTCLDNNILGTVLIGQEGVNGQLAGEITSLKIIHNTLEQFYKTKDLIIKFADVTIKPFSKLKIKIKPEVITLERELKNITCNKGVYIEPENWDTAIAAKDAIVIDTRNDYEYYIGSFKNAINPNIASFKEFPDWVDKNLLTQNLENKKIYMFCTGGIRCEKTTSFIKEKYNIDTFHLKGGILDYLYKTKNENNMWVGNCFVFDDRVLVTEKDYKN